MSADVISGNGNKDVKLPIYMDNHATTRPDPRVVEEMLPYFNESFGNAASRNHEFGWVAEQAVEQARERIAKLIGANTKEIIFTSGATESDNLAIKGVAEMYREKGNHIITQATEHKAVLDTCKRLEKYGFRVTYLPVQKDGRIDLDTLPKLLTPKTKLVSLAHVSNVTGALLDVRKVVDAAKAVGAKVMLDGAQRAPHGPLDLPASPLRLLGTPPEYKTAPPLLGEHTEQVLTGILSLDAGAIAGLRESGVI